MGGWGRKRTLSVRDGTERGVVLSGRLRSALKLFDHFILLLQLELNQALIGSFLLLCSRNDDVLLDEFLLSKLVTNLMTSDRSTE